MKFLYISFAIYILLLNLAFNSSGERMGTGAKCISKSRKCTEHRIHSHAGSKEVRAIFQDALYHYCLDLFGCQEGKEQICQSVGRSDEEYAEPNMRKRLVRQCNLWRIPIKTVRMGEVSGHFVNFHDIQ